VFARPRGYFGLPRDRISFDGQSPPGVPAGVAGVASSKLKLKDSGRAVVAEFDSGLVKERIVARAWPAAENRLVVLEMHH
jgi:triacylglycerol lipase